MLRTAVLALVLASLVVGVAGSAMAASPSAAELQAWLADLDADEYAQREQAGRQLAAAGDAAIETLAAGVSSASPEASWRASVLLEQVALAGNEATLARAAAALDRLSKQGKPGLATSVSELRAKQARLRHDRAAARIRALGGKLSGESPFDGELSLVFGGGMVVEEIEEVVDEPPALPEGPEFKLEPPPPPEPEPPPPPLEPAAPPEGAPPADAEAPPIDAPAVDALAPPPPADLPPLPPLDQDGEIPSVGGDVEVAVLAGPIVGEIADAFVGDAIAIEIAPEADIVDDAPVAGLSPESLILDSSWRGGDDGLAALADLPGVMKVTLSDAPLTNAALDHLARLPRLAELELRGGTEITPKGLREFRRQQPSTRVFAIGSAMLGVGADLEGPCTLTSVYAASGAYEAGLAQGDEILSVDGAKTRDFSDLTIGVFGRKPREKVAIEFKRNGEVRTVEVMLKDRKVLEAEARP